jgi:PBSX family phage terminase large subunit
MQYSTPPIHLFEPLPQQLEVIREVRLGDYTNGTKEILLSGSVGSSKSITLAHLLVTHCLANPGAKAGIGRLALPQLKATLCLKIKEHLVDSGIDYRYNESTGDFKIYSSTIKAVSWADMNLSKLGSMEFSCFAIEELVETKTPKPYDVILQRVNRVPHVKEPFLISASNPDAPSHWAYKKLIESPDVKVFYSNTFDNPYLPRSYIEKLQSRLDPKMAQRMIYGKWVEINQEVVYYAYEKQHNFKPQKYAVDPNDPIRLCFDFNIGEGKPFSVVIAQHSKDIWHFYDETIVDGQRTLDALEEMAGRGVFEHENMYIVHGDAAGRSRDTRGSQTDYDIIDKFLSNYVQKSGRKLRYRIDVPRANPRLRDRHNTVNGLMLNNLGERRLFVYADCKTLDEGFRMTKLKSGASFLENDSDRFQHCTAAVGYAIMFVETMKSYESQQSGIIGSF